MCVSRFRCNADICSEKLGSVPMIVAAREDGFQETQDVKFKLN